MAGDPVAELVAALDGLWRGQRPEEREESERRGGADGVEPVACTLGMEDCALDVGRRVHIAIHGDVAHEPQPGGEPFVVIEHLELGDQRLDRCLEGGDVVSLSVCPMVMLSSASRARVAVRRSPARESHCLAGGSGPAQQLAVALERAGELDQYRRSLGVGSQGRRALEQPRGGGFLAGGRATSGACEADRRACGEARRRRLARA